MPIVATPNRVVPETIFFATGTVVCQVNIVIGDSPLIQQSDMCKSPKKRAWTLRGAFYFLEEMNQKVKAKIHLFFEFRFLKTREE